MNNWAVSTWVVLSLNALMLVIFFSCFILFIVSRKKIVNYIRSTFSEEELKRLALAKSEPSRYAKWALIVDYAALNDKMLLKDLTWFRYYQLGAADSFVILFTVQIFTIWFFHII